FNPCMCTASLAVLKELDQSQFRLLAVENVPLDVA
ncbi:unnamed protein product, partial [Rotaria magnacalcarata]